MEDLAKHFATMAEQFAPKVVNAALQAVQIQAYSRMVESLFFSCLGFVGALFCIRWFKWIRRETGDEFAYIPWAIICVISALFSICGVNTLIDPWTWAAFYHPDAWLAKKALGL